MVIDSSAIVALALSEASWEELSQKASRTACITAAPIVLESHMVLVSRLGEGGSRALERILASLRIEIVPFTPEHLIEARMAFDRFGKGRHPAALNFGDCMIYALSKVSDQPLLYVGKDFAMTDLVRA